MVSGKDFWIHGGREKRKFCKRTKLSQLSGLRRKTRLEGPGFSSSYQPGACQGTGRSDWQESRTQLLSSSRSHHPHPTPPPSSQRGASPAKRARPEAEGCCWQMGAAEREGAEWGPRDGPPGLWVAAARPPPAPGGSEGTPSPQELARGPRAHPGQRGLKDGAWYRDRATRRGLRAWAAGFPAHSSLTLKIRVTVGEAAALAPCSLSSGASRTQLAPCSALFSFLSSESLPAAAPTRCLLLPPPRARLRFPSINSRPNSIREGSFELLCLLGEMWAQEGSRYNFHFLKCLREHPGFLSPHQARLWARVSSLVTQLSPNKRSSQSPGEGELPAIHDPRSRWSLMGKTGRINHRAVLCFLSFLADLPTVWKLSENKLTLSCPPEGTTTTTTKTFSENPPHTFIPNDPNNIWREHLYVNSTLQFLSLWGSHFSRIWNIWNQGKNETSLGHLVLST